VAGSSTRYIGLDAAGWSCWLYRDGTTYLIGILDEEHTEVSSGSRYCLPANLNESGQVIGNSRREDAHGISAWLYDQGITSNIGLTDTFQTGDSYPLALKEAGQAVGVSPSLYASGSREDEGVSAWFYENGVTSDITLTGREYARFDGFRISGFTHSAFRFGFFSRCYAPLCVYSCGGDDSKLFNDGGHVVGHSIRFDPASNVPEEDLGLTAWLYKNGSYIKLGITDAAHTASDGTKVSSPQMRLRSITNTQGLPWHELTYIAFADLRRACPSMANLPYWR
jgi:hypothetical protein